MVVSHGILYQLLHWQIVDGAGSHRRSVSNERYSLDLHTSHRQVGQVTQCRWNHSTHRNRIWTSILHTSPHSTWTKLAHDSHASPHPHSLLSKWTRQHYAFSLRFQKQSVKNISQNIIICRFTCTCNHNIKMNRGNEQVLCSLISVVPSLLGRKDDCCHHVYHMPTRLDGAKLWSPTSNMIRASPHAAYTCCRRAVVR